MQPSALFKTDLAGWQIDLNANVVKLEHNQFKALDRLMRVALELTVETNGHDHIASVMEKLEAQGYSLQRVY